MTPSTARGNGAIFVNDVGGNDTLNGGSADDPIWALASAMTDCPAAAVTTI